MNEDELDTSIAKIFIDAYAEGHIDANSARANIGKFAYGARKTVGKTVGSTTKAPKVYKDARGNTLDVGTRVAFNYSGDVAIGTITHVTPGGEFHIQRETHQNRDKTTLSRVKRTGSLIAITEVEDVTKVRKEMRNAALEDYANANKELLRIIANAWDLDEVQMILEEKFGKDWRDEFSG